MKHPLNSASLGVEIPEGMRVSRTTIVQLASIIGVGLMLWVWFGIFATRTIPSTLYVLDVGQGDSQLIVLASEDDRSTIKILIDGGRDKTVLTALDEALGSLDNKYIDIVILTHTDFDHLGGLIEVVRRYDIGMFISNGRAGATEAYDTLTEALATYNIPTLVLLEGDSIRYGDNRLAILSPDRALLEHKEINESGIVTMLQSEGTKALFTADIGLSTENMLLKKKYDLAADILKVGHHGSKYSSSENFIAAVRPLVSVIGVGKNRYGHPTARVLETLELVGSSMYRTDEDGTIRIPLGTGGEDTQTPTPRTGLLSAVMSIMTGAYKTTGLTTVSLQQAREEARAGRLVLHKECVFASDGSAPAHSPVVINEVAWMGSATGATHEWIELRTTSSMPVDISGWQILNENERLHITFPQQSIFDPPYMVLARSVASVALGLDAELIFTGSLRNSNEGLRLYDNECNLIDEVPIAAKWPAGDNATKQTMERMRDLLWGTSIGVGGTPNKENTGSVAGASAQAGRNAPLAPMQGSQAPTKLPSPSAPCAPWQININMASKEDLMDIRHIGEARADDIIASRPFTSLPELREKVSGIGESRLADIIAEGRACVPL
ncbi:MAG: MBL fold metallo-hydrolase [bacterium]|nr:MBL fold metallo-hydrolase [bacterium]